MNKKILILWLIFVQAKILFSAPTSKLNVSFLALEQMYPIDVTDERNFFKWLSSIINSSMFIDDHGDNDYFKVKSVIILRENGCFFRCIPVIGNTVSFQLHDPKQNKPINLNFYEGYVKTNKLIFELVNLDETKTMYFRLADAKFFSDISCNNQSSDYACGETFFTTIQQNINAKIQELFEAEILVRQISEKTQETELSRIYSTSYEQHTELLKRSIEKQFEQQKFELNLRQLENLEDSARQELLNQEKQGFLDCNNAHIELFQNMEQKNKLPQNLSSNLSNETEHQENPVHGNPIEKKDDSKIIGFGKFFVILGLSSLFYVVIKHTNLMQKIKKSKPKVKFYENNEQIELQKEEKTKY